MYLGDVFHYVITLTSIPISMVPETSFRRTFGTPSYCRE